MAAIAIENTKWTEVAAAGSSGTYQVMSGGQVHILKQDSDPGDDVLTGLSYRNGEGDSFDTTGVWARLPVTGQGAAGSVEVT